MTVDDLPTKLLALALEVVPGATLLKAFAYSVVNLGNLRDGGLIQQAGGPLAGRDFLERGE
jgi:hypothetical protein